MLSRVNVLIAMVLLSLAACGNDDGDGDTLFNLLSSVVLLGLAIWLCVHAARKRG